MTDPKNKQGCDCGDDAHALAAELAAVAFNSAMLRLAPGVGVETCAKWLDELTSDFADMLREETKAKP